MSEGGKRPAPDEDSDPSAKRPKAEAFDPDSLALEAADDDAADEEASLFGDDTAKSVQGDEEEDAGPNEYVKDGFLASDDEPEPGDGDAVSDVSGGLESGDEDVVAAGKEREAARDDEDAESINSDNFVVDETRRRRQGGLGTLDLKPDEAADVVDVFGDLDVLRLSSLWDAAEALPEEPDEPPEVVDARPVVVPGKPADSPSPERLKPRKAARREVIAQILNMKRGASKGMDSWVSAEDYMERYSQEFLAAWKNDFKWEANFIAYELAWQKRMDNPVLPEDDEMYAAWKDEIKPWKYEASEGRKLADVVFQVLTLYYIEELDIPLLLHLASLFGPLVTRENLERVFELDQEWAELSVLHTSLKLRAQRLAAYTDRCAPNDHIGRGLKLHDYEERRLKNWWEFGELGGELGEHQLPAVCQIGDVPSRCLLPARSGKEVLRDFDAYLHDLEEKQALHEHDHREADAIGMGVERGDEPRVRGGRQNAYYQFGSLCKFKQKSGSDREQTLLEMIGPRGLVGTAKIDLIRDAAYVAAAHERELEQHEKHNAGVLDQALANGRQDDFLHLMRELKMKPTLWGKRHAIARFRGRTAIEDARTYEFQCEGKAGDGAFQLKGEAALEHLEAGDFVTFKAASGEHTTKKHKVTAVLCIEEGGTYLQLEGENVNEIKPPGDFVKYQRERITLPPQDMEMLGKRIAEHMKDRPDTIARSFFPSGIYVEAAMIRYFARDLANNPFVRGFVRQLFSRYVCIHTTPTPKGRQSMGASRDRKLYRLCHRPVFEKAPKLPSFEKDQHGNMNDIQAGYGKLLKPEEYLAIEHLRRNGHIKVDYTMCDATYHDGRRRTCLENVTVINQDGFIELESMKDICYDEFCMLLNRRDRFDELKAKFQKLTNEKGAEWARINASKWFDGGDEAIKPYRCVIQEGFFGDKLANLDLLHKVDETEDLGQTMAYDAHLDRLRAERARQEKMMKRKRGLLVEDFAGTADTETGQLRFLQSMHLYNEQVRRRRRVHAGDLMADEEIEYLAASDPILETLAWAICAPTEKQEHDDKDRQDERKLARSWNKIRVQILQTMLVEELYPQMRKELQAHVLEQATRVGIQECCDEFAQLLRMRPFRITWRPPDKSPDFDLLEKKECLRGSAVAFRHLNQGHVKRIMELRRGQHHHILSLVFTPRTQDGPARVCVVVCDPVGELVLEMRLETAKMTEQHPRVEITHPVDSQRVMFSERKQMEAAAAAERETSPLNYEQTEFTKVLQKYLPGLIVVGALGCSRHNELDRIKRRIEELADWASTKLNADTDDRFTSPWSLPLVCTMPMRVAVAVADCDKDLRSGDVHTRRAVSLCRFQLDPMSELLRLWDDRDALANPLLDVRLTRHQAYLQETCAVRLQERMRWTACDWVARVGVDVNRARRYSWLSAPLQFVAGLGPTKAKHLLTHKVRADTWERGWDTGDFEVEKSDMPLISRQELNVLLGEKVAFNCACFLRIFAGPFHITEARLKYCDNDTTKVAPNYVVTDLGLKYAKMGRSKYYNYGSSVPWYWTPEIDEGENKMMTGYIEFKLGARSYATIVSHESIQECVKEALRVAIRRKAKDLSHKFKGEPNPKVELVYIKAKNKDGKEERVGDGLPPPPELDDDKDDKGWEVIAEYTYSFLEPEEWEEDEDEDEGEGEGGWQERPQWDPNTPQNDPKTYGELTDAAQVNHFTTTLTKLLSTRTATVPNEIDPKLKGWKVHLTDTDPLARGEPEPDEHGHHLYIGRKTRLDLWQDEFPFMQLGARVMQIEGYLDKETGEEVILDFPTIEEATLKLPARARIMIISEDDVDLTTCTIGHEKKVDEDLYKPANTWPEEGQERARFGDLAKWKSGLMERTWMDYQGLQAWYNILSRKEPSDDNLEFDKQASYPEQLLQAFDATRIPPFLYQVATRLVLDGYGSSKDPDDAGIQDDLTFDYDNARPMHTVITYLVPEDKVEHQFKWLKQEEDLQTNKISLIVIEDPPRKTEFKGPRLRKGDVILRALGSDLAGPYDLETSMNQTIDFERPLVQFKLVSTEILGTTKTYENCEWLLHDVARDLSRKESLIQESVMASPAFADRRRSATEFFKTANDFEQAPMQKMLEECLLNELAMPWKDPRQDTAYAYDSRAVHWEWQGDLCSQRDHPFYKDIFLEAVGTEESFGPGRVVPLQLMAHATEFVAADGQLKPRFTRFRCVTNKLMCTFRATPGSDAAVWLESRCPPGTQIMARVERIDYQRFQADVSMTPEGSDAKAMERDEESETRPFATPQLEDEFSLQMQADRRAGDSALVGKLLRPDGTVIDDTEAPKGERLHHLARHRLFSRRSEHELVRDLLRPDRRVGKVHFRSAANNAGVVAMMKVREKVPANVDRTFQIKSFYIKEAGEHYAGTGFSKRLEYSYPTESGVVTTAFLDIDEVMHRLVEPYHQRMRELVGHRKFCAEGVDRLLQDEGARQLRTGRSGTVPYFLTWDDQGCRGGFVLKWWSKYQKAVKSDPVEIRPEGFAIWLRVANTPELMIQHWKDSGASRNQMKQDYKKHVEKLQLIPSHEENLTGGHSGIVLNRQPQRLRLLQGVIPLAPDEVAQIRRDERMPDLEANALSDPITVGRHAMSSPLEDGRPVKKYAGTQGQLSNLSDAREDTPVTGQTGQEGPTIGYSDPYDAAFSPVERMDYSPDSPEDDYDGSGRRHRAGDGAGSSYGASIHASSEFGTGSSNLGSSNLGSSSLGSDPRGPAHAPVAGPSGSGPGSGSDSARGPQPKRKPAVPTWNRPAAEPSRDSDLPGYHPGQESEVEGGDPYTVDEARGLASESEVEGGDPGARPPKRAKR